MWGAKNKVGKHQGRSREKKEAEHQAAAPHYGSSGGEKVVQRAGARSRKTLSSKDDPVPKRNTFTTWGEIAYLGKDLRRRWKGLIKLVGGRKSAARNR